MTDTPPVPDGPSFLEASRLAASARGAPLPLFLGMSGTAEPLLLYLRGAAAERGRAARVTFPPFGTLGQALLGPAPPGVSEVLLAFPWDLLPEADWRTGSGPALDPGPALARAESAVAAFAGRFGRRMVYVTAPVPPLGSTPAGSRSIELALAGMMAGAGAAILGPGCFSLSSYLASGCPVGGAAMGGVARQLVERVLGPVGEPAKVLVTDFDNTLWAGVLSEDGEDGIAHGAVGRGFRHFIYQTYLARLVREGILLVGVTRNSPAVVESLFGRGGMVLKADDFVAVLASYDAKSAQIAAAATRLNLGLDAFVFVDDNEVELEEVSRALPAVRCLRFPAREDDLPGLLTRLADWFGRQTITAEDRERTAMYRRRLEGLVPEGHAGADIRGFLQSLAMRLEVADRSRGDRVRAVQLINKTNQFNLNGRRWTDEDVEAILAGGGRLICATLSDRSGSHGEILALLMGADRVVEAWVMSCRVFQRRVEHAFLLALIDGGLAPAALRVARTERNEPMVRFLAELGMTEHPDGLAMFDAEGFRSAHEGERQLFQVAGASSLARFEHASGAESVLGRP